MTKLTCIILALALLSACATSARKMTRLSVGMSKSEVVDLLGDPAHVDANPQREALLYRLVNGDIIGDIETYVVILKDGKVARYGHIDFIAPPSQEELNARAARSAASMQMMMNAMPRPNPMPVYQPQRPVQTQCQTRVVNGTAYSDCNSQPTGLDTSIYNQSR